MIGKVEWKNISWSKTRCAETNEMTYSEHQSCVYTLCRNHFTSNTVVHKKWRKGVSLANRIRASQSPIGRYKQISNEQHVGNEATLRWFLISLEGIWSQSSLNKSYFNLRMITSKNISFIGELQWLAKKSCEDHLAMLSTSTKNNKFYWFVIQYITRLVFSSRNIVPNTNNRLSKSSTDPIVTHNSTWIYRLFVVT